MAQKYAIKGIIRDCTSWSELGSHIFLCGTKRQITLPSYKKLRTAFEQSDRDDIAEFQDIRVKLIKALEGKKI